MKFPSREIVESIRREYPAGTRVELVQMDDGINIRRTSAIPHRTLEERLTAFYGKPIDQIDRIEGEELDWGKAEGSEAW